jgi:hypothetical protein
MTHTPGPWIAEFFPNDDEDGPAAEGDVYYTGEFFRVLDVDDDPVEYISLSRASNARLIAAAPEMLEALKTILADWEAIPEDEQVPDEINVNEHWDAVRAAIAKAEGK